MILVINGPPCSGKSTLAQMLLRYNTNAAYLEMGKILGDACQSLIGTYTRHGEGRHSLFKETFFPAFNATGRQLCIDLASHLKSMYGDEIIGIIVGCRIARDPAVWTARARPIPPKDGAVLVGAATVHELNVLKEMYKDQIALIRVSRPGCDYTDGRNRIVLNDGTPQMDVNNHGGLELLNAYAIQIVRQFDFGVVPDAEVEKAITKLMEKA